MIGVFLLTLLILAVFLIPRALLIREMEFEYNRLFQPNSKRMSLLPYLVPYWGGIKLCEAISANILKCISKIMFVCMISCILNTTIMRLFNITYGWYPIISIYYNIATFSFNYIVLVLIAFKSAKTIQSPISILFCFFPPLSFYIQSTIVRYFFKLNKDELRGTFYE